MLNVERTNSVDDDKSFTPRANGVKPDRSSYQAKTQPFFLDALGNGYKGMIDVLSPLKDTKSKSGWFKTTKSQSIKGPDYSVI